MMVLDQQTEVGDGMTWLLRKITLEKKKNSYPWYEWVHIWVLPQFDMLADKRVHISPARER